MELRELFVKLEKYIRENTRLLTAKQARRMKDDLQDYVENQGEMTDQLLDFFLWLEGNPSRIACFADYLDLRLLEYSDGTILEVNCGPRPLLAQELLDCGYNVEAIDPSLERCSRIFRRERFTSDYSRLDLYSAVVSLASREDTDAIVDICLEHRIPFFIVPHGLPNADTTNDWRNQLTAKCPSIRFSTIKLNNRYSLPLISYF